MRWIPIVFVRIFLFFTSGIFIGIYFPDVILLQHACYVFVALAVAYVLLAIVQWKKKRFDIGIFALTALLFAGYINVLRHTESRLPDHLIGLRQPIDFYKIVISKSPEEKAKSWKTEASLIEVHANGSWKKSSANLLLYFSKSDFTKSYQYGDVLLIKGSPQLVQPPFNPDEFDFQKYLSFKNIYHQQFIRGNDARYIEHNPPNTLMEYTYKCRTWADNSLKTHVNGKHEQGIASALVLGVNDGLDNEMLSAYASTGTLHVLSVSGLHVSIVYLILVFFLKPLNNYKGGKWGLAIISLIVLWGYAFITGLSPSVLRAVTMFSFVALAKPWGQRTNIYNTLAISAFFLLLYDPYLIMSVGFQLSYLAVLGIVYLQPKMYRLWEPKAKLWDELWKVTSVSIAAQLATFSLGLLYFHQFPNYFLFSNLLVIPESFGVLIGGLAVLVFNFITPVAHTLGWILEWIIKIMNFTVFSIDSLPFSVLNNIYINASQCLLLMAMIVMFILLLQTKKIIYLSYAAGLAILFSGIQWIHYTHEVNVNRIVVYHVPGHRGMDLMSKHTSYFTGDSLLTNNKQNVRFHIDPNRLRSDIKLIKSIDDENFTRTFPGGRLIHWKGKSLLYIESRKFLLPEMIKVDYCIVGGNSVKDLLMIKDRVQFQKLIIDSSNTYALADKLLQQSVTLNIPVHSVWHQHAFVETFTNL